MARCTVDFQDLVADLEEADGRTIDVQLRRADEIINSTQESCASRCAAAMNNVTAALTHTAQLEYVLRMHRLTDCTRTQPLLFPIRAPMPQAGANDETADSSILKSRQTMLGTV
jgi:hypothetical protein